MQCFTHPRTSRTLIGFVSVFTSFMILCGQSVAAEPISPLGSTSTKPASAEALLNSLTLEQKLGQLQQAHCAATKAAEISEKLKADIREGRVGSILNAVSPEVTNALQRIALTESKTKIPLVFARDVIHGYRTIMPIPLGQAASWNADLVQQGAEVAAREAASMGIRWTFAPMIDISRDARWGRIAESFGEDPYLTSLLGVASVKGYQGDDLSKPHNIAATAKHFLGYGAAEGGRDYNTVYIPEPLLHDIYLPPFAAAIDAGAATIMSAFHELNGVPTSLNQHILDTILRKELGFKGVVVSDWGSIEEGVNHGYTANLKEAALKGVIAGVDVEMVTTAYQSHLHELIKEGKVDQANIDQKVRRVLELKQSLGLFAQPYTEGDPSTELLSPANLAVSQAMALESLVLLKNKNSVLPLNDRQEIALIGPLADAPHDQLGTWVFDGRKQDTVTVRAAMTKAITKKGQLGFESGTAFSRSRDTKGFSKALTLAKKSDVILFVGGEEAILSGEAHSRADIRLPGAQEALIRELKKTGKPIVLVIMAGRPIALNDIIDDVDAVLMAWHPGTLGGPAITDVVLGKQSPSGRLPLSWPKVSGQAPLYYNHNSTGRPPAKESFIHMDEYPLEARQHSTGHRTFYIDAGFEPQFPFGFGLTYSKVEYSNLKLDKTSMTTDGKITVSARIENKGDRAVTEIVQLYIRDHFASSVRPVRELKNFQRLTLAAKTAQTVTFTLPAKDLAFYNQALEYAVEPGEFSVWIAPDAASGLHGKFTVSQ